jgi:hypothetical protein
MKDEWQVAIEIGWNTAGQGVMRWGYHLHHLNPFLSPYQKDLPRGVCQRSHGRLDVYILPSDCPDTCLTFFH